MQRKSVETILYSTVGVVIMLAIIIAINFIAGFGRTRVDLTQEKAYTLSEGTKAILKKLDTPVRIRFYCTQPEGATAETVCLAPEAAIETPPNDANVPSMKTARAVANEPRVARA